MVNEFASQQTLNVKILRRVHMCFVSSKYTCQQTPGPYPWIIPLSESPIRSLGLFFWQILSVYEAVISKSCDWLHVAHIPVHPLWSVGTRRMWHGLSRGCLTPFCPMFVFHNQKAPRADFVACAWPRWLRLQGCRRQREEQSTGQLYVVGVFPRGKAR